MVTLTQLNKEILVFDVDALVSEILKTLAEDMHCTYVILRRPKPEQGEFWFYVFLRSEFYNRLTQGKETQNDEIPLITILPQLHEAESAPRIPSHMKLPQWSPRYELGVWEAAGFPVALQDNKPIGVWEMQATPTNKIVPDPIHDKPLPHININEMFDIKRDGEFTFHSMVDIVPIIKNTEDNKSAEPPSLQSITPHKAFPKIDASNKHPVVGESITLTVTLEQQADAETTGSAILPPTPIDFIFKLQVHLLCAGQSQWDSLEYRKDKGTLKPAKFQITTPDITQPAANSQDDYVERERQLVNVNVNFYYENRWVGDGVRFLDLRLDDTIPPVKRIPKPTETEWRKLVSLQPDAQPPDLLIRIQRQQMGDYHWTLLSPHLQFDTHTKASIVLQDGAETFVKNLFEKYSGITLDDKQLTKMDGVGEDIYDNAPDAFKDAYWQLYKLAEQQPSISFQSILFITDEPYVPWELMRVADPERGFGVLPELLAVRHAVGRWMAECSSHLMQQIEVQEIVTIGSDYASIPKLSLPWVKAEMEWLNQHYQTRNIPLTSTDVLQFLQTGKAQAVHFACHGEMSPKTPLDSALIMEDHPNDITSSIISTYEVQTGLGAQHPLVFLNACQSGAVAHSLALIAGFPSAFLKAGASAVICPLWTISDAYAKEITEQFYQAAFSQPGATLGEVMQSIHKQWKSKKNLTFLAYVLYGDPQARVSFHHHP